ncbi:MAG: winged helix-turn-helix domain-containing protein [Alphaproteobacteria bacterium]|nr:winged helix-turn-helix domain-containing protein [Alphaproteobacteria bacterium]MCB9699399.1 winged helix-turn-helix domain-containing protein [Alphaproteobacteria bacterium]
MLMVDRTRMEPDGLESEGRTLHLDGCTVDLDRRLVWSADGTESGLTANEHVLLEVLAKHLGRTVPSEQLLEEALGYRPGLTTRALSNAIWRLRQKIERQPARPRHLKSVYGVGYRLELAEDRENASSERLVGRDEALAELEEAVDAHRLVTLVGPGGIGKTTLARVHAHRWQAVWVDLGAARRATDVTRAMAAALHISTRRGQVERSLVARRDVLVVLDEAEHALDAVRDALTGWLQTTTARFLVTSRRPLAHADEVVRPVSPLAAADAAALLRARAPWLDVSEGRLLDLVERLDGLPKAIELAAARTRVLSVDALQARLDLRRAVLTTNGSVLGEPLRRIMDTSWEALAAEERRVAAACAWFGAPCTVEELESTIGDGADHSATVERLVDHSLVLAADQGRVRMLGPIRHDIRARATPEEAYRWRSRHAAWALDTAERWVTGLGEGGWDVGVAGLERLEPELLAVARDGAPEEVARAVLALDATWQLRADPETHASVLDEALALGSAESVPALRVARARLHVDLGEGQGALSLLADMDGAPAAVRQEASRLLALALAPTAPARAVEILDRALADVVGGDCALGRLLAARADALRTLGDLDGAERSAWRALPLLARSGHRLALTELRQKTGALLLARGDLCGAAEELRQEALGWEELGVAANAAQARAQLARILLRTSGEDGERTSTWNPGGARELLLEAREVLGCEDLRGCTATADLVRAELALGLLVEAETHAVQLCDDILRCPEPGALLWVSHLLAAAVSERRGRPDEARGRLRRARLACDRPDADSLDTSDLDRWSVG